MGGLKPIGSEKLQGMDKIRRIMEIAKYNENIPKPVNEVKSNTYSLQLADGKTYSIVKERQGYIIKESVNGEDHYVEHIQERKYYNSYSQALRRLNLMAKEMNVLYENRKGTPLFEESEKKKYYLKLNKKDNTEPLEEQAPAPAQPAPVPAPAPQPVPPAEPTPMPVEPEMDVDMDVEEEPEMDDEMDNEEGGDKKGEVTFKLIQKLTGKLTQKLRAYSEKEEMSSDDVKYVINSVISAIDLESLDEEDIEEIIDRLEGEEIEEEPEINPEDEMGAMGPEPGLEGEPVPPGEETPEIEMAESFKSVGDAFVNKFKGAYSSVLADKMMENERREGRRNRHYYSDVNESKVDKIISSYFDIKEDEYLIKEEKTRREIETLYNINSEEIKRLSENVRQQRAALKFIERNPKATILGLTVKKNLVFKNGLTETKITRDGKIL